MLHLNLETVNWKLVALLGYVLGEAVSTDYYWGILPRKLKNETQPVNKFNPLRLQKMVYLTIQKMVTHTLENLATNAQRCLTHV